MPEKSNPIPDVTVDLNPCNTCGLFNCVNMTGFIYGFKIFSIQQ